MTAMVFGPRFLQGDADAGGTGQGPTGDRVHELVGEVLDLVRRAPDHRDPRLGPGLRAVCPEEVAPDDGDDVLVDGVPSAGERGVGVLVAAGTRFAPDDLEWAGRTAIRVGDPAVGVDLGDGCVGGVEDLGLGHGAGDGRRHHELDRLTLELRDRGWGRGVCPRRRRRCRRCCTQPPCRRTAPTPPLRSTIGASVVCPRASPRNCENKVYRSESIISVNRMQDPRRRAQFSCRHVRRLPCVACLRTWPWSRHDAT